MVNNPYSSPDINTDSVTRTSSWKRIIVLSFFAIFVLNQLTVLYDVVWEFADDPIILVYAVAINTIPFFALAVSIFYLRGQRPERWKRFWEATPYILLLYMALSVKDLFQDASVDESEKIAGLVVFSVLYLPIVYCCLRFAFQPATNK